MTRILIAGSRSYNDYEEFRDIMNFICKDYNNIEIVSGGANGADFLAEKYAKEYKLKLTFLKLNGIYMENQPAIKEISKCKTIFHNPLPAYVFVFGMASQKGQNIILMPQKKEILN